MQNLEACPHCGAELPRVADAYCPQCREELTVDEPAAVETPVNAESQQQFDEPTLVETQRADEQSTQPEPETPTVRKGRIIVNCVLGVSLALDAAWFVLSWTVQSYRLQIFGHPQGGLLALAILGVCIYQGMSWARYVMSLKCGFFGIAAGVLILDLCTGRSHASSQDFSIVMLLAVIVAAGNLACSFAILAGEGVDEFVQSRREQESSSNRQAQATCEECGHISAFPGRLIGTTQKCLRCSAYIDVRG